MNSFTVSIANFILNLNMLYVCKMKVNWSTIFFLYTWTLTFLLFQTVIKLVLFLKQTWNIIFLIWHCVTTNVQIKIIYLTNRFWLNQKKFITHNVKLQGIKATLSVSALVFMLLFLCSTWKNYHFFKFKYVMYTE